MSAANEMNGLCFHNAPVLPCQLCFLSDQALQPLPGKEKHRHTHKVWAQLALSLNVNSL